MKCWKKLLWVDELAIHESLSRDLTHHLGINILSLDELLIQSDSEGSPEKNVTTHDDQQLHTVTTHYVANAEQSTSNVSGWINLLKTKIEVLA